MNFIDLFQLMCLLTHSEGIRINPAFSQRKLCLLPLAQENSVKAVYFAFWCSGFAEEGHGFCPHLPTRQSA